MSTSRAGLPARDPRSGLERMLRPRSVAFVGASASPVKVGGRRWLTMIQAGFKGCCIRFIRPPADVRVVVGG